MGKKLTALLLALMCLLGAAAAETEPVYASTRAFAAVLQEEGVPYQARGVDAAEEDSLVIAQGDCSIHCFFTADGESVCFVVWYLIGYAPADEEAVMLACSRLNAASDGPRFFADSSDCTVTATLDVTLPWDAAGTVAYRGYRSMAAMLPPALEALAPYDITRMTDDVVEGSLIEDVVEEELLPVPEDIVEEAVEDVVEEPIAPALTPAPAISPAPAATPAPTAAPQPQEICVTASSARVRSGPGTNSPYLCTVKQGDVFPVIGVSGEWYIITVEGRTGFISMSVASPQEP